MSVIQDKISTLRDRLLDGSGPSGALLVIYPPEEESPFRAKYDELIQELRAQHLPVEVLDLRTLVFEVLEARNLLEKAFQLDAKGSIDARRSLASMVQEEVFARVKAVAERAPETNILLKHTAAPFPWISYSTLLEDVETKVLNTLVIPFPGTENGPMLHFLGVKDGYNYRAARI